MEGALKELFGASGDPSYRYDGKTDRQITREQMRAAGFDDTTIDARMDDVLAAYVVRLQAELEGDTSAARLCAGVHHCSTRSKRMTVPNSDC